MKNKIHFRATFLFCAYFLFLFLSNNLSHAADTICTESLDTNALYESTLTDLARMHITALRAHSSDSERSRLLNAHVNQTLNALTKGDVDLEEKLRRQLHEVIIKMQSNTDSAPTQMRGLIIDINLLRADLQRIKTMMDSLLPFTDFVFSIEETTFNFDYLKSVITYNAIHKILFSPVQSTERSAIVSEILNIGLELKDFSRAWDLNTPVNSLGHSFLHLAVINNKPDIVSYLLENHAHVDALDDSKRTPLFFALSGRKEPIAWTLLEYGACIDKKNNLDQTPLCAALRTTNISSIQLLVQFMGMDTLNKHSLKIFGHSILHETIQMGYLTVIPFLIENGADVNHSNSHGNTPLHFATYLNSDNIILLLLDHKADLNARNHHGIIPLISYLEMLIEKNNSPNSALPSEAMYLERATQLLPSNANISAIVSDMTPLALTPGAKEFLQRLHTHWLELRDQKTHSAPTD